MSNDYQRPVLSTGSLTQEDPRLLILVGSAGIDPWLRIEEEAQKPIIEGLFGDSVKVVWFQGNPELLPRIRFKVLERILDSQLRLMYAHSNRFRRSYKNYWKRFGWNAVGSAFLRRLLASRQALADSTAADKRVTRDLPIQMPMVGLRTIESMRFCLDNYEFDYFLRITSNCLPVPRLLSSLLHGLPQRRVYAGTPMRFARTDFASGAAVIMSRDVVEGVCRHSSSFSFLVYEDVALGKVIEDHDLATLVSIPRLDVSSVSQIPSVVKSSWPSAPIVRCKAERPVTTESEPVIRIMRAIEPHLNQAQPEVGPAQ